MADLTLEADGAAPVVCWPTGCMKIAIDVFTEPIATASARPTATPAWLDPVAELKADRVCLAAACRPFGKKLFAAIAEHRAEGAGGMPVALAATSDLKAIIVGQEVWSLPNDRPLKIALPPSIYGRQQIRFVEVAGALLVVHASGCAAPCTTMLLTDSSGRSLTKLAPGGGLALQLSAQTFAVVSENSTVSVFSRTGRPLGTVKVDSDFDGFGSVAAVRLAKDDFAVMVSRTNDVRITALSHGSWSNKPENPFKTGTMHLPRCAP